MNLIAYRIDLSFASRRHVSGGSLHEHSTAKPPSTSPMLVPSSKLRPSSKVRLFYGNNYYNNLEISHKSNQILLKSVKVQDDLQKIQNKLVYFNLSKLKCALNKARETIFVVHVGWF